MRKSFFILAVLVCTLLSCSKHEDVNRPDDPNQPDEPAGTTLTLSTNDLVFEAAGGWKEFTINCSGAWTLTGGNAWCQPGATSGSGRTQVKVMAEASTLTSDRNVNLTVRCGSQSKVLAVTQKGVNALTLTKDKFEVAAEGGDLTVTLQANVECTSTIPSAFQSWIKKSPGTKAMTSQSFRYTVSPNEDTQKREGYIVFSGGSKKDTVYVYQSAKIPTEESSLILSENTYNLSAEAQEITVELKTNIDYEVIVPDTVETWVSHLATRAIRTDKLHFSIAENEGDDARSAVVIIKEQDGELTDTLYIRQAQEGALVLGINTFQVPAEGKTITMKLTSNMEYDVVIPDTVKSWISHLETKAMRTEELKFVVAANETPNIRTAVVIIQLRDGKLTDTLHFTQLKKNTLAFKQKEVQVKAEGETFSVELQTNLKYSVIIPDTVNAWISRSENESVRAEELLFVVAANATPDARTAVVIVKSVVNNLADTLHIYQEPANVIIIGQKKYAIPLAGKDISIEIKSNVKYDVVISQQAQNWIQEIPATRGVSTNILNYRILKYNSDDDRTGEIIVRDKNSRLADTIQIVQGGRKTYVGDVELKYIANLIEFSAYTKIIGNVSITGSNLSSLQELSNRLREIDGSLIISCTSLRDFNGLGGLASIGGDFRINSVSDGLCSLSSFAGLNNLASIGGDFSISASGSSLSSLSSFAGLDNLASIGGDFSISASAPGSSYDSGSSLRSLSSFAGLNNLASIGGNFSISASVSTTCSTLSSLNSLDGLNNLKKIGNRVFIVLCKRLSDYCALRNALQTFNGTYQISDNKYNPTKAQILNGACSQ